MRQCLQNTDILGNISQQHIFAMTLKEHEENVFTDVYIKTILLNYFWHLSSILTVHCSDMELQLFKAAI